MRFGIFGGARTVPGVEDGYREGYQAYIDAVVEAEALGYYSNFLVEHHFSGMGQVSASLNLLSYLAARTSTIRLGTAVVVIPWHNPILIAEQAATVDLLSRGRLDFGVGKGYRYNEFQGFCIPIEEASERFDESMAVIRKAWTTEGRFSHQSKRWRFENVIIEPAPVQKPHPPLWLAAGRPDSLAYTAREGYNLFLDQFQTLAVIFDRLNTYKRALAEAGRTYDPLGVAVARALLITRTKEEREAAIAARARSLEVMNAFGRSPKGDAISSMVSDADLRKATEEGALIGTPDEIARRLERLRAEGVDYVLLATAHQQSLRTFAKDIMPAFA
jgi:alkanesulfonate monooxygenase SsuD/methylene tetrahydromethanopterin reductase-like flavin-dependent oxidoreductase (luciferase family)